jgi:hypothetical protein
VYGGGGDELSSTWTKMELDIIEYKEEQTTLFSKERV